MATVLATRPTVLVLDEPTFGQDARPGPGWWTSSRACSTRAAPSSSVTHDRDFVDALGGTELVLGPGDGVRAPAAAR